MGYASWGSNDGNWNRNYLPNSGFDTLDATWQSGSRYWNHTSPTVAPEDNFQRGPTKPIPSKTETVRSRPA